jgi:hypothetical protein
MPSITNVGGSLTSAIALTLLAWAVRFFRAAAQQRKQSLKAPDAAKASQRLGRFFCALSPAALRMLVSSAPTRTMHAALGMLLQRCSLTHPALSCCLTLGAEACCTFNDLGGDGPHTACHHRCAQRGGR